MDWLTFLSTRKCKEIPGMCKELAGNNSPEFQGNPRISFYLKKSKENQGMYSLEFQGMYSLEFQGILRSFKQYSVAQGFQEIPGNPGNSSPNTIPAFPQNSS